MAVALVLGRPLCARGPHLLVWAAAMSHGALLGIMVLALITIIVAAVT